MPWNQVIYVTKNYGKNPVPTCCSCLRHHLLLFTVDVSDAINWLLKNRPHKNAQRNVHPKTHSQVRKTSPLQLRDSAQIQYLSLFKFRDTFQYSNCCFLCSQVSRPSSLLLPGKGNSSSRQEVENLRDSDLIMLPKLRGVITYF